MCAPIGRLSLLDENVCDLIEQFLDIVGLQCRRLHKEVELVVYSELFGDMQRYFTFFVALVSH